MLSNFVGQKKWIFFILFIGFWLFNPAQILGQTRIESVGNINVIINSNSAVESKSKYNFDVPVNKNVPILGGEEFRAEQSEAGGSVQIYLSAIADKQNLTRALLKSTLTSTYRNKTKIIQKKIVLSRGQTKIFRLRYKNLNYYLTAFYQFENKKI